MSSVGVRFIGGRSLKLRCASFAPHSLVVMAKMEQYMSERIEELKWVLTDLILDLCAPAEIFRDHYSSNSFDISSLRTISICRMCNSHAVIALSKLVEALNGYGEEIRDFPDSLRKKVYEVKQQLEARNVYKFRSKYVAHVFDNDTKKPVDIEYVYKLLTDIVGKDISELNEFYEWLSPAEPDSDLTGNYVSTLVTVLRDHCNNLVGHGERP